MPVLYQNLLILVVGLLILYFLVKLNKEENQKINWLDLITDSRTGRLDYKKLGMSSAMLLQSFTWLRLSLGYEVNSILANPTMWVVFYAVVAGQDIIIKYIQMKANAFTSTNKTDNNQGQ